MAKITRKMVLATLQDGSENRTVQIVERIGVPGCLPRVATVLRSAWGANLVKRSARRNVQGYGWQLTTLGREFLNDD